MVENFKNDDDHDHVHSGPEELGGPAAGRPKTTTTTMNEDRRRNEKAVAEEEEWEGRTDGRHSDISELLAKHIIRGSSI